MWIISTFLIHCLLTVYVAQCNIDIFEPIIRSSPEVNVTKEDLFGYKVVLHQLVSQGGISNTRMVVSAPYGQAPNAVLQRTNNDDPTGVIYTCPISPGRCDGLAGDGTGDARRLYDVDGNAVNASDGTQLEEKRGQFLGSTLKSTGNTVLVCGHRYLDYGRGLDRSPYGVCYISGQSLMSFQRYSPCNSSPTTIVWEIFDRDSRSFFGHGQCQAGTAGDIINESILLGAPGTFAWRGAVFRRSNTSQTTSSGNGVGTDPISWQGYEVVTGRINSQSSADFIVSVPRFNNYRGRVNIYNNNNDDELRPIGNPPLAGNQVGAYYGFSVAAVDLQGLGMDDLLVSAPMYSPEINRPEYGIVFVYRNNQRSLSLFTTLEGRIPFGRFGHAMAKLGDINGDSYEDVAISTPFGDQPGTVYIYAGAGSRDIINENPIQTIVGTSLNLPQLSGLRSFGSSLSSNVDVDNNGYNDLVVGAYLSQKIFLLRTRPVARLAVNIDVDVLTQHCNNQSCFDISSCMMYSGAGLQNILEINYELSVTAPIRVRLSQEVGAVFTGRISGSLILVKGQQMCVNTTAILEEELIDATRFEVQFIPTLASNNWIPNSAWDGNMSLSSLETAPVLSVAGDTSVTTYFETLRSKRMSHEQASLTDQLCSSATSCTECFMSSVDCIWCAQPNYTTIALGQNNSRCVRRDDDHGCDPSFIEDPTGSTTTIMNQPFGGSDYIQVSPQRLQVSLRPGQPQSFTVSVRPANNFPADIYLLMDHSFSMEDDLENLRNLASQLAETVQSITENFQLGFGSFVDKPRVPYISVEPSRLIDPCQEVGVICQPTYSFRHTLNLTSNASLFASRIQDEIISGNLDSPEDGFDAMLQVISCQNIIGWRKNSRRILVHLSDAGFHFAGDGKLGGIVVPHDGQCYLEQRGNVFEYTMAEKLDYPSVGQINYLLQKFDIIPIFAAEATARSFYESLRQVLNFAVVGTLAYDSSNIVDLIRDTYNSVSQTVRLVPDSLPGVRVEITPMCENVVDSTCTGVVIGQTASFDITLTADELINDIDWIVRIPGFGQFMVELTGVSDCNCTSNPVDNSNFCNDGNGDLVCGQCVCDAGWFGERCECSPDSDSMEDCPLGLNGIECTSNERGTCVCGTCQCNQIDAQRRYFGQACECDNFSCDRDERNLVCGGPSQGTCICGQVCACQPGWTGRACDCELGSERCISPLGLICSGRGNCVCGECLCDHEYLSGAYCEFCTGNETKCQILPDPSTVVTGTTLMPQSTDSTDISSTATPTPTTTHSAASTDASDKIGIIVAVIISVYAVIVMI